MAAETGMTDNPYGIQALWTQSDYVGKGVFVILAFMSLYSWYTIFTKIWDQYALNKVVNQADKNFWNASSIQEGVAKLKGKENAIRDVAEAGLRAVEHHTKNQGRLVTSQIALNDWIETHVQRRVDMLNSELQNGMAVLASVGSTAPFVGLFGTVWGIYHALISISIAGQASLDKVAGPIGEALIMTAIGLAVAVPAVLGYNILLRRNKGILEKTGYFSHDLQQALLAGSRVGGAEQAAAAGRK
ncbi:MAG: MotA/TolQ/ExbB proton channel family protein [Steroidobacteraceae bacterium]